MKNEEQISFFLDNEESNDIVKELHELREKIEYHNRKYYEEDEPEISDYEYDKLTRRLRQIEQEHPEYIDKNSPTQKIGGRTKKLFSEVKHDIQMQSLQDVFSFSDVEEFVQKVQDVYGKNTEFVVETKIDGLSVSLEYVNGKLIRGSTRGDGFVGEDITDNVNVISDIPKEIEYKGNLEVRGEVYLGVEQFDKINDELLKEGKKVLANPRNAAAGTLRQLDSNLVKKRNLSIFIFNVQKSDKKFTTHNQSLEFLSSLGFTVIEKRKVCSLKEEVLEYISYIGKIRNELKYQIDGAVVKVNNLRIRDELGTTVKVPKWAVAYKYPPEQKTTKILDIVTQVGRTGQVTPMAILEPVRVAGSLISKTTLHNFDYIDENDIRIGDMAVIEKAGDVIPEVVKTLKEKRDGTEKQVIRPVVCPVCNEKLEKAEKNVALRCVNSECPALAFRSIVHFASRNAMDISGLGENLVEKLIDSGLLKDVADIYYLKYNDILSLERMAQKSAKNIIDAINKTKENTLDKLIFGLGIRHIGKKAAKILSDNFSDIYEISNANLEQINALEDFGQIMAESVVDYFKKDKTKELVLKLESAGVNLKSDKKDIKSEKLKGMTFVVTGSFDNYSRNDIVKLIEENLGKYSSSVSKKTSYVIAGEDAGSKEEKANKLGIAVISINDFLKMLD